MRNGPSPRRGREEVGGDDVLAIADSRRQVLILNVGKEENISM